MSAAHTAPDAMVTVKVTYDGTTRRVKMPLREMVPRVLEEHIRTFLHIPTDRKSMIERYSDSAASFVLLESSNMPVYKQLYRAAKAKSKLKLRVTLIQDPPKPAPKPVSIEHITEPAITTQTESQQSPSQSRISLPLRSSDLSMTKKYDPMLLAKAASMVAEREELRKDFESRLSCLMSRQSLNPTPQDTSVAPQDQSTTAVYAVCCNICNKSIPDAHYHCSTCDDGDFDLCQSCIDQGLTCKSDNHWLIKRSIVDGSIVKSSTEKISPKPKPKTTKEEPKIAPISYPSCPLPIPSSELTQPAVTTTYNWAPFGLVRTCNTCLHELPEAQFLHCQKCDDFDLCQSCFSANSHGHHPMHGFAPAVPGTLMPDHISIKMAPGRNRMHMAICDGCDKNISGVRHKCLDCPDWDYCAECVESASFIHPNHRFAPLYEPLDPAYSVSTVESMHMGICCDGPLCKSSGGWPAYIKGTRYKCAICPDLDFCANCEANPSNDHNKTHPLIKFKTPVRHVNVTTTGEHQDGRQLHTMGDRFEALSRASSSTNSVNAVQTVVDVKPEEPEEPIIKSETKEEEPLVQLADIPQTKEKVQETLQEEELKARFVRESVSDGTIYGLNHVFEQTWTLRNDGNVPWPAGCVVKFSGGDYMGHVDSTHPAGISDLVSASQSTICYSQLAPGQEYQFTVLLRTPTRAGNFISYWRICTKDGVRFGDRLWCEVQARSVKAAPPAPLLTEEEQEQEKTDESLASSTMIFPKLEKESPNTSVHEDINHTPVSPIASSPPSPVAKPTSASYLEWDGSDDGFMTDEEYDILDASDEEYLEQQHKKMMKE